MALILYSKCCSEGFRFFGGAIPTICPRCQEKCEDWTAATHDEPAKPYLLSTNDAKFLRSIRVDAELPPKVGTVES
jgi:hypothetical protein